MCETSTPLPEMLEVASHAPNNLFSLLSKYRVIVPGIQRHYVQGANTVNAIEVRTTFIRDIFTSMHPPQPLCLDFIYGPIDTAGTDAFVPVDGQQRLTTLWLLARYFADLDLDARSRDIVLRQLERFTYEDRVHATRFCHAFTSSKTSPFKRENAPSVSIKKSEWFNPYWTTDTTVAGMLNTLDTIDEIKKKEFKSLSVKDCLNHMCTLLTFQLCVDQFADDIYMKMNARGLTLTQWEKFKGRFSKLLGHDNHNQDTKNDWDVRIEELSDIYYSRVEELMKFYKCSVEKLPDNAFYSLMARIVVYEVSKVGGGGTGDDHNLIDQPCYANIVKLARHRDWKKDLPYVPFDEFINLFKIVRPTEIANSFLATIAYVTATSELSTIPTPYWQEKRTVLQSFFCPENKNESDFSLCIYNYVKAFSAPTSDDYILSLRFMWNILNDVSEGKEPYNRVYGIQKVIEKGCPSLYPEAMTGGGKLAVQFLEEQVKASVYLTGATDEIELMQETEKHMHGRIRLGILNLNNNDASFRKDRLQTLKNLCDKYSSSLTNEPEKRKKIVLMVVAAAPYGLQDNIVLNTDADNLRRLLTTRDDACLQINLIDYVGQKNLNSISLSDIHLNNKCDFAQDCWCKRDWRKSILLLAEGKYGCRADDIWGGTVREHNTHYYYLYKGATVRGAWPINDYRMELISKDSYVGLGEEFSSISANDWVTHGGKYRPECASVADCMIYFYPWSVQIWGRKNENDSYEVIFTLPEDIENSEIVDASCQVDALLSTVYEKIENWSQDS